MRCNNKGIFDHLALHKFLCEQFVNIWYRRSRVQYRAGGGELEGEGAAEAEFVEDNVQLIDNGGNRERTEIKLSYGGLAVLVVILVVSASAAIGLGIESGFCASNESDSDIAHTTERTTTKSTTLSTDTTKSSFATFSPSTTDTPHEGKLPPRLSPLSYEIEMKPDIYHSDPSTFTTEGSVRILFKCLSATRIVTLHLSQLNITSYKLSELNETVINIPTSPLYDVKREFVKFMTETPLAEEQTYILEIEYNGLLSRNVSGLYYDSNADVDKADNLTLER
ncbi:hypothetical protein EB796_019375 [Bugula neritina]|uniref:Aminopeptidase N-like N-terminal domain-containing protein n=1 Tax=Bugula neritina TaxID=10212 RepID=A0A7J7J7U2_BUGNE|nr:hypothetical protein EB796_019375 [Bugula neritina]